MNRIFLSLVTVAGLSSLFPGQAAYAVPEMASGDRLLSVDIEDCLASADRFISTLEVETTAGDIDRSGYFQDGSFRILCYPNPYVPEAEASTSSMVVIFAVHESDFSVVSDFVQLALDQIEQPN